MCCVSVNNVQPGFFFLPFHSVCVFGWCYCICSYVDIFLFFCQKHGVCFLNLLVYLSHCPLNFESMSAWFSIFSVLKYFLYLSLTVNCLAIHGCLIPFNFIGHFPSFFKTLITDQCTNYIFTTSFLFSFAQFF